MVEWIIGISLLWCSFFGGLIWIFYAPYGQVTRYWKFIVPICWLAGLIGLILVLMGIEGSR